MNGSKTIEAPPVELILFVDNEVNKVQSDLFTTSISEVCSTRMILILFTKILLKIMQSAYLNHSISISWQMK